MIEDYFFSVEILSMIVHINRLASGSMPAEGSSSRIIGGLPKIEIATESFRLLPPERVPASLSL